jgi:hypothetical protein
MALVKNDDLVVLIATIIIPRKRDWKLANFTWRALSGVDENKDGYTDVSSLLMSKSTQVASFWISEHEQSSIPKFV